MMIVPLEDDLGNIT